MSHVRGSGCHPRVMGDNVRGSGCHPRVIGDNVRGSKCHPRVMGDNPDVRKHDDYDYNYHFIIIY